MWLVLVSLVALSLLLWRYIKKKYERFNDTGLPFEKPVLLLGNTWRSMFRRIHLIDEIRRLYNEVGDDRCKFVGVYNLTRPIVMLKDLDIIKKITVKEFDHFAEHDNAIDDDIEPLLAKTLVSLKGQMWREMRAALSPAFTSSKIRDMCPLISECGRQMNAYLINESKGESGPTEIDVRDLATRFMTDVIATTAFGIKVDSFKEKENDFFVLGGKITANISIAAFIRAIFITSFPRIAKYLNMTLFPARVNTFFRKLILDAMKYREDNGIIRKDMVQLLMEAKKGSLEHDQSHDKDSDFAAVQESDVGKRTLKRVWTDDELVAQAVLFFFAGFETASTLMSFLLFEVALNPDVQQKLQDEVDNNVDQHGDNVTYEMIQKMKYLDMVVSEGLRKWPPAGVTDRKCIVTTDIGPVREGDVKTYTVKKDELLWIPIYGLHMDSRYFPNPTVFDPERFSDENKGNIKPFTYLPFGSGPRNCIASRFALLESKLLLFHLVSKFTIEVGPQTKAPLHADVTTFSMRIPKGFSLKFLPRKFKIL